MLPQHKKWLKIFGIAVGIMILWGIIQLYSGATVKYKNYPEDLGRAGQKMIMPISQDPMEEDMLMNEMVAEAPGATGLSEDVSGDEVPMVEDKKVIKNGDLELKVGETEEAVKKIGTVAKAEGGEVFSTNIYERTKGSKRGLVVVKVPVEKFEKAMEEIKKVATHVVSESSSGQDVTEYYTDLQARLKNKQAEEAAFVKILEQSGEISDVLAVTREVSRVRGEIERLQVQIKNLEGQTNMSTISVSLSEDVEVPGISDNWRPWQVVKSSFKTLVKKFQSLIDGLIGFIIVGIPQLIVLLLVAWFLFWVGKKIWKLFARIFHKDPPIQQ